VQKWLRPDEVHPGFTRALVVVQAAGVAHSPLAPPAGAVMIELTNGHPNAAQFNIFLEQPGANLNTWFGKNSMGTELVARLPLAEGAGTCAVVLLRAPVPPGQVSFPRPSKEQVDDWRTSAARGELYMTIFGEESDGAIWAMDGRVEPLG
jgi:hypothetical protein